MAAAYEISVGVKNLWIYVLSAAVAFVFFFFQAEDGIRDLIVTGVQTCALPIFVFEDRRLLAGEVPEERALRNLGRFGDLADRGLLVTLLAEEAQRVVLDRTARADRKSVV